MDRTPRVRRARRLGWAIVIASPFAGLASVPASASPAPIVEQAEQCTGQNQPHVAPYSCSRTRDIDGISFTAQLDVTATGAISVTYSMPTPLTVDTPIRFRSHRGISSGPTTVERSGVIPAGQTSATLSADTIGCGQIDIKAIYTGNGDSRGRITAPYVTTSTNCEQVTTSTDATTSSTPPTQITVGSTSPTTASQVTPAPPTSAGSQLTSAPPTTASSSTRLPATGSSPVWPIALAGGLLAAGLLLLGISRRTLTP